MKLNFIKLQLIFRRKAHSGWRYTRWSITVKYDTLNVKALFSTCVRMFWVTSKEFYSGQRYAQENLFTKHWVIFDYFFFYVFSWSLRPNMCWSLTFCPSTGPRELNRIAVNFPYKPHRGEKGGTMLSNDPTSIEVKDKRLSGTPGFSRGMNYCFCKQCSVDVSHTSDWFKPMTCFEAVHSKRTLY